MPVEGRGLSSEPALKAGKDRRLGNLATPASVQKLQTTLHVKAKDEPKFRFYALYDKIYRLDVLARRCRGIRGRTLAWGTGATTQGRDLSSGCGQKGLYSETEWKTQAPGYCPAGR